MIAELFAKFGGAAALSELLGLPYQTVAAWKRRGIIPARHQRAILLAARECGIDITADDLIGVERAPSSATEVAA